MERLTAATMEDLIRLYYTKGERIRISETGVNTCTSIIQAGFEILSRKSIDNITVGEISSRAGYTRSTFYEYFKDKYDVVETAGKMLIFHIKINRSLYSRMFLNEVDAETMEHLKQVLLYSSKYYIQCLNNIPSFRDDFRNSFLDLMETSEFKIRHLNEKAAQYYKNVYAAAQVESYLYLMNNPDPFLWNEEFPRLTSIINQLIN